MGRRKQPEPRSVTAQEYRELARRAFANARGLAADVNLLMEGERHSRALSLGVIGMEELGKAVLFCLAATAAAPGVVKALTSEKGWTNPGLNHGFKQFVTEVVGISKGMVDDYLNELRSVVGYVPAAPDPLLPVILLLDSCADYLEERHQEEGAGAGQAYYRGLVALLSPVKERFSKDDYQTPEEQKWRGLYVPLVPGKEGPESVQRGEAGWQVIDLNSNLEALTGLEAAVNDNDAWQELTERLSAHRSRESQ